MERRKIHGDWDKVSKELRRGKQTRIIVAVVRSMFLSKIFV